MTAILIVNFGSPRNKDEMFLFLHSIFADPQNLPFRSNIVCKLLARPIAMFAKRGSLKKYEAVGFSKPPILESSDLFFAAQYGDPSIEDVIANIDSAGYDRVIVLPLYPHITDNMYDSIVQRVQSLKQRHYRNISFNWAPPFYDHPVFINAWTKSIKSALKEFDEPEKVYLLFSAHAALKKNAIFFKRDKTESRSNFQYEEQVAKSVELIWQALGQNNPISIAYQSARRIGRWSQPRLEDEISRLIKNGVKDCLVIPISFLFDNVETLFDIDREAIPDAISAGMRSVKRPRIPDFGSVYVLQLYLS